MFADIRGRITDVEDQAQTAQIPIEEPTHADDPMQSRTSETPLERICALPEYIADRELITNQKRARFIANNVRDYIEKGPAGGYNLKSRTRLFERYDHQWIRPLVGC